MPKTVSALNPRLTWKKIGLYALASFALSLVFALYFVPEVVIGLANQAWALCGW
jgi:hypothetical protein